MPKKDEKPHFSASQLGLLEKCGVAYDFRYNQGLKIAPGALMHAGTGTHKSAETDLRHKIAEGELLPDDVIPDLARDATLSNMETEGLQLDKGQSIAEAKGVAVDRAVRLAGLHHHALAPTLEPTHVERKFRIKLDGAPRDLIGFIDVQEKGRIRDLKTKSKSPSQGEADSSGQLSVYAAGHLAVEGVLPDELVIDALVDTKTPKLVQVTTTRTKADIQILLNRITRAAEVVERGAFTPAPTDAWWCGPRWCGFWAKCDFGGKGRSRP